MANQSYYNTGSEGPAADLLKNPNSFSPNSTNTLKQPTNPLDGGLGSGNAITYSFTDVTASIILPFSQASPKCDLPGLTLISLSEHRDVYPVVSLGRTGIKGMTTGHRTTAGTLGFVLFGQSPFADAIQKYVQWKGGNGIANFTSPDELPPFDLSLVFLDEYQNTNTLLIRSLKILDRSQNISVRDIQLTEVYSFMAARCSYFIENLQVSNPISPVAGTQTSNIVAPLNPFMSSITNTPITTISPTTTTTTTTTTSTSSTTTTTTTTTTPYTLTSTTPITFPTTQYNPGKF